MADTDTKSGDSMMMTGMAHAGMRAGLFALFTIFGGVVGMKVGEKYAEPAKGTIYGIGAGVALGSYAADMMMMGMADEYFGPGFMARLRAHVPDGPAMPTMPPSTSGSTPAKPPPSTDTPVAESPGGERAP